MTLVESSEVELRELGCGGKESNLHLRGQSPRCCQLHHPAMCLVDPTRLKRAPHRLKGGCSVSRAPGQELAVTEGFEPSDGRINRSEERRVRKEWRSRG